MNRPRPDPELKAWAIEQVNANGRSTRDVAAELAKMGYEYSFGSVANWARAAKQAPAATPDLNVEESREFAKMLAEPARVVPGLVAAMRKGDLSAALAAKREAEAAKPAPDTPAVDVTAADVEVLLRETLAMSLATIRTHRGTRDDLAMRASDQIQKALDGLRKLEAKRTQDADQISFSRDDLRKATMSVLERVINPARAREGLPPVDSEPVL